LNEHLIWIATGERHVTEQQRNNEFISLPKCCTVNTHTRQNRFRHKDHQMEVSKYTKLPFKMVQRVGNFDRYVAYVTSL